ncbi:cytochrome P450 4C1-like isoform X4 [Leptinotarsa decemlineata]|uniref:cytochrome P450 4C1-like isoform X4 n=1 Tax=Leptinotarsa decemlineata TaxID=7539 RepID=UPI003D309880
MTNRNEDCNTNNIMMDISTGKFSSTDVQTYLVMSLITVFGVWYIRFLWNRRYLYIYSWNMEGPLSFPFLGCGYLFLGSTHELLMTLIKTQENSKTGIVRLWLGTKLVYLISEPTHIEKILNHPNALNKDDVYKIITSIIGEGLLTAPVDTWKRHRKLIAPSFNQIVLSSAVDVFTEHCSIFAKELKAVLGKKNVDLYEWVIRTTFDIICQSIERLPFLNLMLKDPSFTMEEVIAEAKTFCLAGSETNASSTCFLLNLLGLYPEVQQKVYEEIIDILGPDRTILASDLPQMKYTERVIKENLRLFPVATIFGREIEEDIDLGNVILPKGSSVYFTPHYIHRNPKYWTNPLKFDPDRFSPDEIAKRHPCTFIPFSYGPRNCIGWKYAIFSMKIIIATIIREFKIFSEYKSIEEIEVKLYMLSKLKDRSKFWLELRQ